VRESEADNGLGEIDGERLTGEETGSTEKRHCLVREELHL